ncbi:MAG: DUF975 family protein [Oscillospiraceae bacterium]|nr:DUF975 family protein [Oscillospiraceae bacterium]
MKWTNELLKTNAKLVLKQHYWIIFGVTLVTGLLAGASAQIGNMMLFPWSATFSERLAESPEALYESPGALFGGALILVIFFAVFLPLTLLVSFFLLNPLLVGERRFLMETREGRPDANNLLWAFQKGRYTNVVKAMLLLRLRILFWTLLFFIPGIVKSYEYYYVPWLLAENPSLDCKSACQLSKRMTDNEKLDIFFLELSFLGWILLGMLALCVGSFFVTPYMSATYTELYLFARARALENGSAEPEELPGLAPPL